MGIAYNTSIVRSGLVLHLDAANVKSYPGSGTVWKDLTKTANATVNGTTPPISTDGIACFDLIANLGLTSSTAVSGFTIPSQPIPTIGSFTINCWVKNVPTTVGQQLLFSNSADANGYRFGIGTNGIYWLIGPSYNEGTLTFSSFTNTQWNNVCAVFDRSGTYNGGVPILRGYLNGSLFNSVSMPASQTAWPSSGYTTTYIARGAWSFASYSGKLSTISAYSKALSAAEIAQNFEATRGRYSI